MSDLDIMAQVIKHLKAVQERPNVFIPKDYPPTVTYLIGIRYISHGMRRLHEYLSTEHEVIRDRGLAVGAEGLWNALKRSGMTDEAAETVLIEIEIEIWERMLRAAQDEP